MDRVDYKILNILKENGRETTSGISKAIRLSVSAVLNRTEKMGGAGIIEGYMMRVDSKALGNDATALMKISLKCPRLHNSLTEVIMDHPNILGYYYLTGDYDFAIEVTCASLDELESIYRTIKNLPGVSAIKTHFVLKEIKDVYSTIPELQSVCI